MYCMNIEMEVHRNAYNIELELELTPALCSHPAPAPRPAAARRQVAGLIA